MSGDYYAYEEFVTSAKQNEQTDNLGTLSAQNAYQVLQANNVFENKDYIAVDEFTDATGTNNTVNTSSSTGTFNTDHYGLDSNADGNAQNDTTITTDTSAASSGSNGFRFTVTSNRFITKVSKDSADNSTRALLRESGGTIIETVNFSGDIATFVTPHLLIAGTSYRIEADDSGSSRTRRYDVGAVSGTFGFITLQSRSIDGSDDGGSIRECIEIVTTEGLAFNLSDTVICDTGTLTLDNTEKGGLVYVDATLPTGNAPDGVDDTTDTELTESSNSSVTDKRGLKINTNEDLYIQNVTKESTCTATKAYVVDESNIFNIQQTTFDNKTFDISSQELNAFGISFSNDGTKMFILGYTGNDVNEYTLSTAYDVSTSSFVDSFATSEAGGTLLALHFNPDGTKMYIGGNANKKVYAYDLGTAWDVSTSVYNTEIGDTSSQTTGSLYDIRFNSDGTKLYVLDNSLDTIFQYTLSTAYDVSSLSYDSKSFATTTQETAPEGFSFDSTGTKMYAVGSTNKTVYQYVLSTAYDVSTVSYDSKSYSTGLSNTNGFHFDFNENKMYIVDNGTDLVSQFTIDDGVLTQGTFSGDIATMDTQIKLSDATDYYILLDNTGSSYIEVTDSIVTMPIVGTYMDVTSGVNNFTTETTSKYYNITEIVSQTNTASGQATSMTVDISDGSTTLSDQTITNKTSGVIDISSLSSGTYELTFTLKTTDTSVTPAFRGWGSVLFRDF